MAATATVRKGTVAAPADRDSLVNRGRGSGYLRPMAENEIEARFKVIEAIKRATCGLELTDHELDLLLSPVNNRRTRLRILGRS